MEKSERVLYILKYLQEKDQVCTSWLAEIMQTNIRNIQKDIKLIKEIFKENLISTKRGCYALVSKTDLTSFMNESKDIKSFFEFLALFDKKQLKLFDKNNQFPIIEKIQRDTKKIFHILEKPIEKLQNNFFDDIKYAVKEKRYATVKTKSKQEKKVKPLKIVFAEGNWYLAVILPNEEFNSGFRLIRINFITKFELLPNTFHRDVEVEDFINSLQSLFQNYKDPAYEVKLLVSKEIVRFFEVKNHLKSQKILERDKDGNLIVSYKINNEMEIAPLVKKWIPHIKVISPKKLDDFIKNDINRYLENK